ncbi:hypothetical protein BO71DRAFT_401037 [Aspergillus ellipticus CBS 707.79]|uniref:Uncharacterized protein n=1 Tax=Aspergillus ellipticus CBS 707.79 TaxID=1448320 RepID=A0A319DC84_9EURO|nr:hypothetical protein BO71DRAFT_401037 [Aspergillus ellipticus CBS 707.79]
MGSPDISRYSGRHNPYHHPSREIVSGGLKPAEAGSLSRILVIVIVISVTAVTVVLSLADRVQSLVSVGV